MAWTHFSDEEVAGLSPNLVDLLDAARSFAHVPFIITSGFRTEAENLAAGGVPGSAHTLGLGVDLRCEGSYTRFRMVTALLVAGFKRIGVYDKHIHVDIDGSLPQSVMWTGTSH